MRNLHREVASMADHPDYTEMTVDLGSLRAALAARPDSATPVIIGTRGHGKPDHCSEHGDIDRFTSMATHKATMHPGVTFYDAEAPGYGTAWSSARSDSPTLDVPTDFDGHPVCPRCRYRLDSSAIAKFGIAAEAPERPVSRRIFGISRPCSKPGCKKRATVEVYSTHNEPWGKYCKPHGEARAAELRKGERA